MKVKQWYKRRQAIRKARGQIQIAYNIIKSGRWMKGSFVSGDNYCLVGALNFAEVGEPYGGSGYGPVFDATRKAVSEVSHRGSSDRIAYNDNPNTTQEDVLDVLKRSKKLVPDYV